MSALHLVPASLLLIACTALAQLPGQYPGQYPPGQGRGRYPGQTPYPQPIPGQTPPGGRQPRDSSPQPDSRRRTSRDKNTAIVTTTSGILRRANSNQLVIEADDHRIVWYRLGDKMTVEKEGKDATLASFALGDYLNVDSTADEESNFTAVAVSWQKAATPADRAAAQRDWDLPRLAAGWRPAPADTTAGAESKPKVTREPGDDRPVLRRKNPDPPKDEPAAKSPTSSAQTATAAQPAPEPAPAPADDIETRPTTTLRPPDAPRDDDDSGPPALRRGTPTPRRAPAPVRVAASSGESTSNAGPRIAVKAPEPEPAPVEVTAVNTRASDDPVIAKAREAAATYSGSLPNFFAQQNTTRYQKEGRESWRALDLVSADVAYEDGKESYKNIKVGNKAVNKSMDEIGGTRSTGEFETLLESLLDEGSGATFRRNGQDTIRNRPALTYTYEVPRERSTWRVESPSQLYYPALRGSIWIDKETSRVLRIEQQGRNLPVLFPFDTVETTTDYDFIRLGTTGPFLLPVEAEVLSCQRGTSLCSRNRIEFRNYRKFGAESSVVFDDKQ